jgi:hypothetical protein
MEPAETALERLARELGAILPKNNNSATITVNAGGLGIWIAATCCIVVMAVAVVGSVYITREFTRQDVQMQELRDKDSVHDAWIQTLNNNKQDKKR